MPIRHALWTVGADPQPVREATLPDERTLEDMIAARPEIISNEWMLIGRQVRTAHGGIVDLLAVAPDGGLVVIELKRDLTPRDVVAQGLDYASWVDALDASDIATIFADYAEKRGEAETDLGAAFEARFGVELDEDELNASHQVVVVAASLDPATERIVAYLADRDVPINVLFFQVHRHEETLLLGRSWLIDPVEVQTKSTTAPARAKEPWNGEWYVSFGHGDRRDWNEARQHGFVSAGGGAWYSGSLGQLSTGDRIWVRVPKAGYVGVGIVEGPRVPLRDHVIDGRPAPEVLKTVPPDTQRDDPERWEYVVPVRWLNTVPQEHAVHRIGMFGNQNSAAAPRTPKWRTTVEQLKAAFPGWDGAPVEPPLGDGGVRRVRA